MKIKSVVSILIVVGLIGLISGCEKKQATSTTEEPKTAPSGTAAEAQKPVGAQTQADAEKAAEALKQKAAEEKAAAEKAAAEKAAADKLAEGVKAATAATEKAQGLIDTAKKLAGENKYAEALKILADLANYKLTGDQQKMVDALKEQVNKALAQKAASEAEKAVGGLLKK